MTFIVHKVTPILLMILTISMVVNLVAHGQDIQTKNTIEFGKEAAVYLEGKKVTIGEAIKIAIKSNFDILAGAYDLAMLDSNFEMYQKKYSPFFIADAKGEYQEFPQSSSSLTGTDQENIGYSLALSKYFPTGTQVSLAFSHDRTRTSYLPVSFTIPGQGTVNMPAFGDPSYHRPALFLSFKQELLQNGFGHNEQREQKQIANAGLIQKEIILYQLSLVVIKVVMDYWNVILKESALNNATLQYNETKSVRDLTATTVALGKSNEFELHYYNVLVAAAKSQKMLANQEYKNAKRLFFQSINLNDSAVLDGPAVLINQLPQLNAEAALDIAYKNRADYLSAKRMLDHANWDLEIAKNLSLPQLSAELSFNTLGQREDYSSAYTELLEARQIGYTGKLFFTTPLGGDPVQKIKSRNARFAKVQAEISIKKFERQIKDEIAQQIEQIELLYQLYKTAQEARQEADTFYQLMLAQLRRGRLNAATVKNGVDALAQSRQQELTALIQFNMANLQFIVTKNVLFEHYGINPKDYIPK